MSDNRNKEHGCTLLIWDFPADLKHELKMKCAKKDISMKSAIIEMVRKYVAK